ncbi:1-(5-phosphoribosyl)-5-[(5-phosphoribosylamino)methylideneamino] imidazole-4-carboxamide isomerase [Neolecta irregularis DAH-3]|uniref:1-(5-phosphoribosyl)-5-[(5-phosphoribosylamino)methylideneamino] imidazole-4-carboxamide isomerase n=1 Tax=Neolecta irregularis (strain DAH-3) TaxID=1198029 RepID=A0A1U7LJM5_NEOID|nr:1-(5-phosphoribosyl)-5-[(5-phosphoribosylamino)methylideneamino] imidazole-4-carboxamide isomerase [Neolecta irregularis DAH-3]|eukprot:OLL22793.1 1-(5-phosphoribosyl)-5-[(5-phosphoribosylamino)methylideneamino] imidazole-4-carboxamide isomerase [Neolecta irregularis DAH-3]
MTSARPKQRSKFRPCIDIHSGKVKQIVGGSLTSDHSTLQTNYESEHPAEYYARLYKENALYGTHVIMLGSGCELAAESALKEWPGMLQLGGGINGSNAQLWLEKGAGKALTYLWFKLTKGNHYIILVSESDLSDGTIDRGRRSYWKKKARG